METACSRDILIITENNFGLYRGNHAPLGKWYLSWASRHLLISAQTRMVLPILEIARGESLESCRTRMEKLAISAEGRQTLQSRFLLRLAYGGDTDLQLQERIIDNIYAVGRLEAEFASPSLSLEDVNTAMFVCRSSASESLPRDGDGGVYFFFPIRYSGGIRYCN